MPKKARTPIVEYDDSFAVELARDKVPEERDRLADQDIVVVYARRPGRLPRWRLRSLRFDREVWSRSAIRRWWAAHEVQILAADQMDKPIPEICRSYPAPSKELPAIILCHRNTPLVPATKQLKALDKGARPTH
jgi:hypothetical protein